MVLPFVEQEKEITQVNATQAVAGGMCVDIAEQITETKKKMSFDIKMKIFINGTT